MTEFHTTRLVQKLEVKHSCEQCGQSIDVGAPAQHSMGVWEGEEYSHYEHVDCHAAGLAYARRFNCWGDDYPWLQHYSEYDLDGAWLRKNYPEIIARLGWALPDVEAAE